MSEKLPRKSNTETVEELSIPKKVNDMWDDLNEEVNSFHNIILNFSPNQTYTIRLVGPFIKAKRFYAPSKFFPNYIGSEEIRSILGGNEKVYSEVCAKMIEENQKKHKTNSVTENKIGIGWSPKKRTSKVDLGELARLFDSKRWQNCVLVNAIVKNTSFLTGNIKIVPFSKVMAHSMHLKETGRAFRDNRSIDLTEVDNNIGKLKINGLYAHDIEILRRGTAQDTHYKIIISDEPSYLPKNSIDKIYRDGLYDIPSILNELNNCSINKRYGYFYKKVTDYRMPSEMQDMLMEDIKIIKEEEVFNESIEELDNQIGDMPSEAFENRPSMNNSINSLRL